MNYSRNSKMMKYKVTCTRNKRGLNYCEDCSLKYDQMIENKNAFNANTFPSYQILKIQSHKPFVMLLIIALSCLEDNVWKRLENIEHKQILF